MNIIMSELQSTIEFSVELYKFYNVDLFQRGMYQVRCSLRVSSKLSVEVEVTTPEVSAGLGTAIVLGNYGACRPFQILYRNEEVSLKDVVLFRCHMLVDGTNLKESLERAEFSLILELWFSESSPVSMVMVSSRTLQLNMSPAEGLHYHLPVLFDYFHLSAISLTIHAVLTALHQPSIKRGLLRYMQSCAPKTSKSWSKTRSAHCSSLTDPVLPVSSHKVYSRINESPQIHLEARDVLLDASNNLKSTIKEYKILFMEREELLSENYDSVIQSTHHKYDSKKSMKKQQIVPNSCLAELCADNIRLWNYFLLNFSCKTTIQQYLSRKHHNMRVKRFSELFFVVYNPRRSAMGCFDTNYQNYLLVAEIEKRSKYMQNLPQLPVHCIALDGDNTTMPIIFEDQYQDPFDYEKLNCEQIPIHDNVVKRSKTLGETNCSCGMDNLWQMRKSSEKTLINLEIFSYEDPLNSIAARHSKSLDQLQMCSKNNFHYSLNNIFGQNEYQTNGHSDKSNFYKSNLKLKNVASEHNMRSQQMCLLDDEFKFKLSDNFGCNCSINNYNYLNIAKKTQKSSNTEDLSNYVDSSMYLNELNNDLLDKKYKQFNIKHLTNVKQHCQKLVKSFSQYSSDSTQNIFRTTSMQFFSPKKRIANGANKFNSLMTKRGQRRKSQMIHIGTSDEQSSSTNEQKSKANGKHFDIGSTSTSTESLSIINKKTGLISEALSRIVGIRKVRSTSCLGEDNTQLIFSGTESLPNISPKVEHLNYPELKYFSSSTSSTTSEQSGWITTSRSSSVASSTDETHPATSAIITIENIPKKQAQKVRSSTEDSYTLETKRNKMANDLFKYKTNKYCGAENDCFSTNRISNNKKNNKDTFWTKGGEFNQTSICDDIALPPPKQFRDLESPSNSVTNGVNDDVEINAVDNILYHVVDTHTTLEQKPNHLNLELDEIGGYNNLERSASKSEAEKSFLRAKNEFKSQLNFPGILYSDLNTYASTVPYFHISDEFRIFSPEGMHLIVCVHGLDGNSADLRLVKTYLELGLPGAYLDFLMSERNQGDTFSDFETMTDRLVSEILHYLDSSTIRPTRISFVGHSLGNVIIRSALTRPQMKFLLPRLHTFLSLSGPHLGTLYNSSGLVNMGMWFMQKWKKSGSLLQLCLKDSSDARQSFLYRLSQRSNLHYFKNVLLCGSGQDRYVPLHSARIELCKESVKDTSDQGAIYREMVHNIISPIIAQKEVNLVRYDIHHALPNTANALIGRAAHIAVLDSELFIEKFMAVVGIKYFR